MSGLVHELRFFPATVPNIHPVFRVSLMFRPSRPRFRCRTLGLLVLGWLAFSVAGGVQLNTPASAQNDASSSPIVFDGWRRTANGWEQLPFKDHHPSINDWIAHQRAEEARNPLSQPLQRLGKVHPVRIAAAEVAAACLIAFVASDRRRSGSMQ